MRISTAHFSPPAHLKESLSHISTIKLMTFPIFPKLKAFSCFFFLLKGRVKTQVS